MKMTPAFRQAYDQLNPPQKLAVNSIDGPVMVIAGPGTGKTQVLAARIANILLKTDTNPSSVLALTFTESAAKNMRDRLVSLIGKTGYYVQIHTFHSFAADIISSHPDFFAIDRNSQPLSELERYDILQSIISQLPLQVLKPLNSPYFYLRDIVKSIADLKREGITTQDFEHILDSEQTLFEAEKSELTKAALAQRERNYEKNSELLQVYQAYQQRLTDVLRYDFEDMIAFVVRAFNNEPALLREYQENLLYVLVDEYQDTNSAQNQIVQLLMSFWEQEANFFVVGDPNQAIYRFQGASIENVLSFTKSYPEAKVITLTTGYRSPQPLYNAAHELITHNQLQDIDTQLMKELNTRLTSVQPEAIPLHIFKAPSQTLESVFLAESIKQLIDTGVDPSEIAILYRNNSDAADISTTLDKWGIRYEIDGGNNVLELPHIIQLLHLFSVIDFLRTGQEDGWLYSVLQYEWIGLDSLVVMKVARAAGKGKVSIMDLLQQGYSTFTKYYTLGDVSTLEFIQLTQFVTQLETWGNKDAQLTFPAWFEVVITDSGFLNWIMQQSTKIELLNALNSLFREIKSLSGTRRDFHLKDFLQVIATMEQHHLPIMIEDLNIRQDAVRLSTVHKAKGQEWEYVFVTRTVDGKWGNSRQRVMIPLPEGILKNTDLSSKERNEDDRRLFYVAITRAKKQLTISYPETIITDNHSKPVSSSVFLTEVEEFLQPATGKVVDSVIDQADLHLSRLLTPVQPLAQTEAEKQFFQNLVTDFRLSITALNTYLRDPQDFIENVLLKIPRAKPEAMAFGTAIHIALEKLYKHLLEKEALLPLSQVLTVYEESLRRELLSVFDLDRRLDYGKEVLTKYYQQLEPGAIHPVYVERFFGSGWSRTMLDDITLTGRVDRIDWLDQTDKTVTVIDYKTGKARSVNYIEGNMESMPLSERERTLPASIRGPYKRQLLFYKLLTQLDRTFSPTVELGVFEFVEPNERGKIIRREFELLDDDVNTLKTLITEVMGEIRSLRFLAT